MGRTWYVAYMFLVAALALILRPPHSHPLATPGRQLQTIIYLGLRITHGYTFLYKYKLNLRMLIGG